MLRSLGGREQQGRGMKEFDLPEQDMAHYIKPETKVPLII
jgi:hypothetical protein